jgi:hypothetical protein
MTGRPVKGAMKAPPMSGSILAELAAELNSPAIDEAVKRCKPAIDDAIERMGSKSQDERTKAAIDYFVATDRVAIEGGRDAREQEIADLLNAIEDDATRRRLQHHLLARPANYERLVDHPGFYALRLKSAVRNLAELSGTDADHAVADYLKISVDNLKKQIERARKAAGK